MTVPPAAPRRFDAPTLEMIVVVMLTTLHDFLLSDVLSLPLALKRGTLAQLRTLDQLASSLEIVVPVAIFAIMFILWLLGRNAWVRRAAMLFLAWVTLRLIAKITLILTTPAHDAGAWVIVSRPQTGVGVLLRDTVVLWFVIFVLFGVWYWVIDGGGPDARRDGSARRYDFHFPQRGAAIEGWAGWRPGLWDYLFLGFSGSTQFGLSDTEAIQHRLDRLAARQILAHAAGDALGGGDRVYCVDCYGVGALRQRGSAGVWGNNLFYEGHEGHKGDKLGSGGISASLTKSVLSMGPYGRPPTTVVMMPS